MDNSNLEHLDQQHQEKIILALKEVILGVTGSFDLDTLLQKIVESCINFSKSSRGSLFLYDEESAELVMRAEKNNAPRLRFNAKYQINIPDEEKIGLTSHVFKTGETLVFNSLKAITSHPAHLGKYNKDSDGNIDCQSLICIPLETNDQKIIGVIKLENVLDKKQSKQFSDKDIYDLKLIANIVTEAITNFQHQSIKIDESINTILFNALKSTKSGNLTGRLRQIAATFKKISNAVGVSIWLIEGSRLVCKGAVGNNYEYLEEKSYDLSVEISKTEHIGITLWIAKSGEKINIKTHQELKSHPQYKGTYDDVLYPNGEEKCESFIGAPLKTGNKIIGVIKADSRIADKKHPEKFFTTEEAQIFSYLSIITSIIVKSELEFKRVSTHDRQLVTLYKLGTECYEFGNSEDIFGHLLIGLTHGEGIGYNRAVLFDLKDDQNQAYFLKGLRGLGPKDKKEGDSIHKHFNSGNIPIIDDSKNLIKEKSYSPTPRLQEFIESQKVHLIEPCELYQFIRTALKQKRSQAKLISIQKCGDNVRELFKKLETFNGNFLAFSVLDADDQIFIGICDNVYSNLTQHDEFSAKAANTFVSQISLALSRLSLKKSKEETTEEAWQEFTAITAHRIGTETSIMSGALNFFKTSFANSVYDDEYSTSWKQDLDNL